MRKTLIALCLAALPLAGFAQNASPVGKWMTIDDTTKKPKSIVEITQASNGTIQGQVIEILQSDHGPNPVCDKCDGTNKNKPIKGMVILWGLKPAGDNVWSGGSILDPAKGKTYKSKITVVEGGKALDMRGFMGIEALGRTQRWIRQH